MLKMKKLAALLMALVLCVLPMTVFAEETEATEKPISVYVTVSEGGEFATDKDGNPAVMLEVTADGKSEYTISDIMVALHEQYSANGADDYATEASDYGDYITKVWGVETSNCGYFLGGQMANGLTDAVSDSACLEVMIYANEYPDTEAYASFNQMTANVAPETDLSLVLYSGSYDENYNLVMNPLEGATITVNGEATELVTDAEGNVTVSFAEAGTYTVSATLTKTVNDQETTAITAPVCVVTVEG